MVRFLFWNFLSSFLFSYRPSRAYRSLAKDWTLSVTRWSCATRNSLRSSRPRPPNSRRSWNPTEYRAQLHQAAAATWAYSPSKLHNSVLGIMLLLPPTLIPRPIRSANRPPSPANWKCAWWAVRICWKTFRADRDATRHLIRLQTTSNLLLKVKLFFYLINC